MDPAVSPTCPRCGADLPAGAERCRRCGFALIDMPERRRVAGRRRSRPRAASLAAAGAAAAAAAAVVLVAGDDGSPPAAVRPPAPVPAFEAERRLELRFGGVSDDETAAVRCPRRIDAGRVVRCELRYADGIPRAMLVRLTRGGELEADIPYPATIRR